MTAETTRLVDRFDFMFKAYLILQAALSVIGAVQVREGKLSRAVIYIPIGMIVSYTIYTVLSVAFISLLGL